MNRAEGRTPFTALLRQWSSGDQMARDALMARAYQELKRIARAQMAGERSGHTLQPTALVHEAYLKLVDSARRRNAARRDAGGVEALTLSVTEDGVDRHALDQALHRLEALDATQARVVELRYFAGLTIAEMAHSMALSTATVERAWRAARAWLYGQLGAT